MNATWTHEDVHLLATLADETRLVTWATPPPLAGILDLLNTCPTFSRWLLFGWFGVLQATSDSVPTTGLVGWDHFVTPAFRGWSYFFDCETRDPASALVVAAEFPLCRAADAFASIGLLVVLLVPDWDKALPAKLRCSADAFGFPSARPADGATLPPVDLPAICNLHFLEKSSRNHYWLMRATYGPLQLVNVDMQSVCPIARRVAQKMAQKDALDLVHALERTSPDTIAVEQSISAQRAQSTLFGIGISLLHPTDATAEPAA